MRTSYLPVAGAFGAVAALAACGGSGGSQPTTPLPPYAPSAGPTARPSVTPSAAATTSLANAVVGVSGTSITVDGKPYLPRSVVIRGFTAPAGYESAHEAVAAQGLAAYGAAELSAAHAFGADTLRFLVSQPGLDPQSPIYDPTYLPSIQVAVAEARQSGFLVLIGMQDETPSGQASPHPMPIAETQNDWDELAPLFGQDRGVMFELYNEPQLAGNAADWQIWLDGGAVPGDPSPAIGMQPMIAHLRAENVQNAFVLDGLDFAHTLQGLPAVNDPLGRVIYAVHPYFMGGEPNEALWDPDFGIPSQTVPVFADEWAAESGTALGFGSATNYQPAIDFVNYLRTHGIALGGAAFDAPGFMVQNVPGWTPTNYDDFSPSSTADDAGLLISNDFRADYSRPLTNADAVTP